MDGVLEVTFQLPESEAIPPVDLQDLFTDISEGKGCQVHEEVVTYWLFVWEPPKADGYEESTIVHNWIELHKLLKSFKHLKRFETYSWK